MIGDLKLYLYEDAIGCVVFKLDYRDSDEGLKYIGETELTVHSN